MAALSFYTALIIEVFSICVLGQSVFKKSELNVKRFTGGCTVANGGNVTQDLNYYRYLVPSERDSDVLYVGAMNFIFKLSKRSLECSISFKEAPSAEIQRRCRVQGKSEERDCQNHIRVIMEREESLYICGTGSYSPITFSLSTDFTQIGSLENGIARCPFDPLDNYTAIQVSDGNPGDSTVGYYATFSDFVKNSPVIYREPYVGKSNNISYEEKMTDREDLDWLNVDKDSPQFVGSFNEPESVRFFFREAAREDKDNRIFARVAKVCKYDLGGGHTPASRKKWLSFQKARLLCALPGDSPYYFNNIYDVYERDDQYYALFYKQGGNLNASAICVYDKKDIDAVFEGKFQYKNSYNVWETLPDASHPSPRLDNCTAYKTNPDLFTDKVSQYQLMNDPVHPMFGRPVYYINGVQFLKIAVSKPSIHNGDISRNIYAASDSGEIYDIFMKNFSSQSPTPFITELNSIYRPFHSTPNTSYAVWDMKFLEDDTLLGFGTDLEVANLNLTKLCLNTSKINTCVLNTKCQWNNTSGTCVPFNSSSSDPRNIYDYRSINKTGVLGFISNIPSPDGTLDFTEGAYATLPLNSVVHADDIVWVSDPEQENCLTGTNCLDLPNKYATTASGDLIIINITSSDGGRYCACPAKHKDVKLRAYTINTAGDTNTIIQIWKQQFNHWTSEFTKWKDCSRTYFDSCSSP